jgi:hypothetical protein
MRAPANDNACFECGGVPDHNHHVVPRSLGGTRTVPLCGPCHARAHGLDGKTWADHRALTRKALQDKKAKGEAAGNAPFGYSADADGRLVVNAAEQAVIARVKALRAAGVSFRAIARDLEAAGVVGRTGQPFAASRLVAIGRMSPAAAEAA